MLRNIAITSRFIPWGERKRAANLPAMNNTIKPMTGEKMTGSMIGRRAMPLIYLEG